MFNQSFEILIRCAIQNKLLIHAAAVEFVMSIFIYLALTERKFEHGRIYMTSIAPL